MVVSNLDGHHWEILYMDPRHVQPKPEFGLTIRWRHQRRHLLLSLAWVTR